MKIIVTEQGKNTLERLHFDIEGAINRILKFVPFSDLRGLSHIIVTDLPHSHQLSSIHSKAVYMSKHRHQDACIELYLNNLFAHIKSEESFGLMLPIQEFGLASAIYHELGHHIRIIRSHGAGRHASEQFAERYGKELLNRYILANASTIDACFKDIESLALQKKFSAEIVANMKQGWQNRYRMALAYENS